VCAPISGWSAPSRNRGAWGAPRSLRCPPRVRVTDDEYWVHQIGLADVDFEGQRIRVRCGRGNKQRVVGFGERAKEVLLVYMRGFRGRQEG
jgi:hypothetical protein